MVLKYRRKKMIRKKRVIRRKVNPFTLASKRSNSEIVSIRGQEIAITGSTSQHSKIVDIFDPSGGLYWSNMCALYSQFRVVALEIRYYPKFNDSNYTGTLGATSANGHPDIPEIFIARYKNSATIPTMTPMNTQSITNLIRRHYLKPFRVRFYPDKSQKMHFQNIVGAGFTKNEECKDAVMYYFNAQEASGGSTLANWRYGSLEYNYIVEFRNRVYHT
jgi:hypothetical protein